jgi:hypothetical protein
MRQQPDERWNGYPKDRAKEYEFIFILGFQRTFFLLGGWIEKQSQDDWN